MSASLKDKTVKGVAWSGIDNVVQMGVTFVVSIVLARLLTPDDYGLLGIILIFTEVCNALINGGFTTALIRKPDATDDDYSTKQDLQHLRPGITQETRARVNTGTQTAKEVSYCRNQLPHHHSPHSFRGCTGRARADAHNCKIWLSARSANCQVWSALLALPLPLAP